MVRLAVVALLIPALAFADQVAPPAAGAPARRAPQADLLEPPMSQPPLSPPPAVVPPDIAKQGKLLAGAYTCKGNRMIGAGASTPLQATLAIKVDLDNAWIVGTWTEKTQRLVDYRTYDEVAKQWTRMQLVSDASHSLLTSVGDKAGEWLWEGAASNSRGSISVRQHESLKGKELKIWGESQLGGTWQKSFEVTCKR